jgi:hypothetical protein
MTTATVHLTLGEPQVVGVLAVHPLFGPAPALEYRAFAQARAHGALVRELEHAASVNTLLVRNPTDRAVLLYEGEQVVGAQQDRTIDSSVLVGAGTSVPVPVSCVEQGRWDGRRHGEHFEPAGRSDDPSLRRVKREAAARNAARGLAARPAQGEVWQEVGTRLRRFAVASESARLGDLFDQRSGEIGALADDVELRDGQLGALACVGGAPVALDVVSRPDVFAALHDGLVRGYALDALGARSAGGDPADPARAAAFVDAALSAPRRPVPAAGLGEAHTLAGAGVIGSSLAHEGELIALCAFPSRGGSERAHGIARPSRRRGRAV